MRLFSDEVFGFHAQQAAENCLKAWLASLGKRYSRTHDLMTLIDEISRTGVDTSGLDILVDLNPFAVEYRYGSLAPDEEALDRSGFFAQIQALFERLTEIIGPAE